MMYSQPPHESSANPDFLTLSSGLSLQICRNWRI
ncbi:hypothetical protein TorRG33x02_156400 [Trema orientale]|uniref:Uncharacterized protein n=1 Tax=Trema orientale TaxID=63057 RepID=A0A2P5ESW1_TREOI|nr:hypothetical protein TorRG33x02_156400 [Trema orientale]